MKSISWAQRPLIRDEKVVLYNCRLRIHGFGWLCPVINAPCLFRAIMQDEGQVILFHEDQTPPPSIVFRSLCMRLLLYQREAALSYPYPSSKFPGPHEKKAPLIELAAAQSIFPFVSNLLDCLQPLSPDPIKFGRFLRRSYRIIFATRTLLTTSPRHVGHRAIGIRAAKLELPESATCWHEPKGGGIRNQNQTPSFQFTDVGLLDDV